MKRLFESARRKILPFVAALSVLTGACSDKVQEEVEQRANAIISADLFDHEKKDVLKSTSETIDKLASVSESSSYDDFLFFLQADNPLGKDETNPMDRIFTDLKKLKNWDFSEEKELRDTLIALLKRALKIQILEQTFNKDTICAFEANGEIVKINSYLNYLETQGVSVDDLRLTLEKGIEVLKSQTLWTESECTGKDILEERRVEAENEEIAKRKENKEKTDKVAEEFIEKLRQVEIIVSKLSLREFLALTEGGPSFINGEHNLAKMKAQSLLSEPIKGDISFDSLFDEIERLQSLGLDMQGIDTYILELVSTLIDFEISRLAYDYDLDNQQNILKIVDTIKYFVDRGGDAKTLRFNFIKALKALKKDKRLSNAQFNFIVSQVNSVLGTQEEVQLSDVMERVKNIDFDQDAKELAEYLNTIFIDFNALESAGYSVDDKREELINDVSDFILKGIENLENDNVFVLCDDLSNALTNDPEINRFVALKIVLEQHKAKIDEIDLKLLELISKMQSNCIK